MSREALILTINSGSSSIKFALYRMGGVEHSVLSGSVMGIGLGSGMLRVSDADGKVIFENRRQPRDHAEALKEIISWFQGGSTANDLAAVGHRLVHGGDRFIQPQFVTPRMITALEEMIPLAPDHLPHEIHAIKVFRHAYPRVKQVACFDTAFHRNLLPVAQVYALPVDVRKQGIRRYGFHGLSYEYVLGELRKEAGAAQAKGRVIIAHLGNGASMVALRGGRSMDTTMGFSPAGGLVMSTRSGDLDPGVILYFSKKGAGFPALNRMVNVEGGLLGVSGKSASIQDLLKSEKRDRHSAEAVELFCYQAKKFLGAFAAVLGGLDTLIFTGGIGENAPSIRRRICDGLEFLGIRLDPKRNGANESIISSDHLPATVRVMKTNEELMIARHTYGLLRKDIRSVRTRKWRWR